MTMNQTFNFTGRSKEEIIGLSVSLSIIITMSLIGNSLLLLIFKDHRLRSIFANKLIMNLAIADFLTAAFAMTYQLATVIDVHLISDSGMLCKLGSMISYVTFSISVVSMMLLSLDRYIALGYLLKYQTKLTPIVKCFLLAIPWTWGLIVTSIFTVFLSKFNFDLVGLDCGLLWSPRPYGFAAIMSFQVGIPFSSLLALNLRTLCLVRKQNRSMARINDASDSSNVNSTMLAKKRKGK